jgi:hypothetical protein
MLFQLYHDSMNDFYILVPVLVMMPVIVFAVMAMA